MKQKMMMLLSVFVYLVSVSLFAGPVTFNDPNLLQAVRNAYEAQVGVPLGDPPTSEELSDPNFTALDASYLGIADLEGLQYCTSLTALNLQGNEITDISQIGSLTNLQLLMLGKNQISDISALAPLSSSLILLDIGYNQISDISVLSTFSSLLGLNLGFGVYGLYPEGVDLFATGVNNLDDADMNVLNNLTNLSILSIGGLENVTSISFLSSLPNLTHLYLGNNPITDWTPLGFVDQNLNVFVDINCGLTQTAVDSYLSNMTNIEYVDDDNPGILIIIEIGTSSDINDISGLSGLNPSISFLGGIGITDISVVSDWTNLGVFVCAFTGISNLDPLIGLPNLFAVSLPENNIGPTMFTLPVTQPFNNLTELSVSGNSLTSLSGIEYMPNLVSLTASNNQLDNIWSMDLEGAPKNTLEVLDLSNNAIVDINPLLNYVALRELNLSYNQIQNFNYLLDNPGIGDGDTIDISYNPVPPEYCSTVDQLALKVLPTGTLIRTGVCEASIEVEIVGEGITTPPVGITSIAYGSSVAIRAYPQSGSNYAFKQWEIWDDGTNSYQYLTEQSFYWFFNVTGNIKVRAVFVDNEPTYTVSVNIVGNGKIDEFPNGSGEYKYLAGRQVSLYVFTGPGAYFAGWTGDVASQGTLLYANILMDSDKTIGAIFENTGYTLTTALTPDFSGGVYPWPNTYYFASGVQVSLTAWANPGYKFDHWEDNLGNWLGTVPNIIITMDSDKFYKAVFVPTITYSLTINVNPPEAGTTNPVPGVHIRNENEIVTIYAIPNPGWFFSEWTGDIGSAYPYNNFIDILMDSNKEVTANFVPADLTLELSVEGADKGEINPGPGTYYYQAGGWVFLNATNYSPYAFLGWFDADTDELITVNWFYAFQVSEGMGTKRIVAKFGNAQYTINLLPVEGNGTTIPSSPGVYGYVEGQWATLIAEPASGWRFKHWVDQDANIITNMNPYPIQFQPDVTNYTFRAVFEECNLTVNVATAGTGLGTTIPQAGTYCYITGEQVYLYATPDANSYFGGWQIIKNPGPNQIESWVYWFDSLVTLDADYNFIAWFESSGYTLQLQAGPNGSVYPFPGTYRLVEGFPVEVYASPNPDYVFLGWYDQNDELVTIENPYEFVLLNDTSLIAKFEKVATYTLRITVEAGQGTTVPSPGMDHQYQSGTIVNLVAIPDAGWRFVQWTGDLQGVPNPNQPNISVLMDRDRNIGVIFEEIPEGSVEGEGSPEGVIEGEGIPEGEGTLEGIVEGEGEAPRVHSADQDGDGKISLSELLRVIQFFNFGEYHCDPQGEDGYNPGPGPRDCPHHASDYNPPDWNISISELLRLIQFFNIGGYYPCEGSEDGFCPGQPE